MKFKIGDKVVLGGPRIHQPFNGLRGVVDNIDDDTTNDFPYRIKINGGSWKYISCDNSHIKLIGLKPTKYVKKHKMV